MKNFYFEFGAVSDVGIVRKSNQDSCFASNKLLIVCDGMGGHAAGDLASSVVTSTLAELNNDSLLLDEAPKLIHAAIKQARAKILEEVAENSEYEGMGTTLTLLLKVQNKIVAASIGDSRIYQFRAGKLTQISKDHSYVQELVDRGDITEDEALVHPQKHYVTKVIGDFGVDYEPDIKVFEPEPDDIYLLCSDGLCGFVSDGTIEEELSLIGSNSASKISSGTGSDIGPSVGTNEPHTPVTAASELLQLAFKAASNDNVTVVIGQVKEKGKFKNIEEQIPIVQGAVASSYTPPSVAKLSPAQKASRLYTMVSKSKIDNSVELDESLPIDSKPKFFTRGKVLLISILTLVLIGIGIAGLAFNNYLNDQYYVGSYDNKITIYRGIPNEIFSIKLSSPIEVRDYLISNFSPTIAESLKSGITVNSLEEANTKITQLITYSRLDIDKV